MSERIIDCVIDRMEKEGSSIISDKDIFMRNIDILGKQKINILLVGATGVGKSSTINAIFDAEIARVGYSPNPETASIEKYEIDNIVLWDSPGLGDSPENDQRYASQIANLLKQKDQEGKLLIDEVVVLIDGSNRDMKTAYEIIENIVIPYMLEPDRIVIAINQCDMGLKGRYWDYDNNCPQKQLESFMNEKVISVRQRIIESTGVVTFPIYYSALNKYNISKLLYTMIKSMPDTKRFIFADAINKDPEVWKKNDDLSDYNEEIQKEIKGSLSKALDGAAKGAVAGATVGSLIPVVGPVIGATVGAVLGFLGGLVEG